MVIRDLDAADKAMMHWMHNTQDVPGNAVTPEESVVIQKDQKAAIERVQRDMEHVIWKAERLLKTKTSI